MSDLTDERTLGLAILPQIPTPLQQSFWVEPSLVEWGVLALELWGRPKVPFDKRPRLLFIDARRRHLAEIWDRGMALVEPNGYLVIRCAFDDYLRTSQEPWSLSCRPVQAFVNQYGDGCLTWLKGRPRLAHELTFFRVV